MAARLALASIRRWHPRAPPPPWPPTSATPWCVIAGRWGSSIRLSASASCP